MDNSNTMCIFCGNKLEDDSVLVKKSLESIIQASLQIKDGLHERLGWTTALIVHRVCRLKYTRPSTIKAATKQRETDQTAPSTSATLRALEEKFDFKKDCFICGKPAVVDSKRPYYRRKPVHLVSALEIKENVIEKCNERNDSWGEKVKLRLLSFSDLVAPEARYHKYCYRYFLKTKNTVGKPKSEKGKAFEEVCKYMDIATNVSLLYKNYRV